MLLVHCISSDQQEDEDDTISEETNDELKKWRDCFKATGTVLLIVFAGFLVDPKKLEFYFSSIWKAIILLTIIEFLLIFCAYSKYKIDKIKKKRRNESKKAVDYIR